MKKNRLIPVLLLKDGWLVQSKGFTRHQNLGNPVTAVKRLSEWASDELIYLDISKSNHYDLRRDDQGYENRSSFLDIIEDVSKVTFMPITVGGRIRTLKDIEARLLVGADKVSINTMAITNPQFIKEAAEQFGSQCIVVSIDAKIVEVFKFFALEKAWKEAKLLSEREHVTPYMKKNSTFNKGKVFRSANFEEGEDFGDLRMTVDEQKDFDLIKRLIDELGIEKGWREYVELIRNSHKIREINANITRDEGYIKSIKNDYFMKKGQELYKKAKNLIPGGTMLLSKRPEMFLPENWPSYFSKTKGCKIWDLDGTEYLDMSIMGIGTNILGYGNEEVDEAVKEVISKGNMSTLNCPEEVALAERLIELHPWADMVRFARTGGGGECHSN